jgi:ABC-2 type transport system ATP-binding protein
MLKFEQYKKQFGGNTVISIPELELGSGAYWLKGENGSGKTTLIKSIAGLIPFEGTITVGGKDIRKERAVYTSKVNYAEAEPLYPDFLTGEDLIRFYKGTKMGADAHVKHLVGAFGIGAYKDNKIGTYSSGMAKKLSLVLAFMGQPELILLDEPLITLDQEAVGALQSLIQGRRADGVSFLITSHQEISLGIISPSRLSIKNKTLVTA